MSLTEGSHKKQVVGIIVVVVFLLAIFVYGTRAYRNCDGQYCSFGPKKASTVETCQAENIDCAQETPATR